MYANDINALAAVAVSGAALAEVTISGIADVGYSTRSLKEDNVTKNQAKGIVDGIQNGSRLIFKGSEDLGGGLSANFNLEYSVSPSTKDQSFDSRQSYVGLSSQFGSVQLGRMYTLHHSNQGAGDLMGNISNAGYLGAKDSLVRASNSAIYSAPTINGVTASVQIMTDVSDTTSTAMVNDAPVTTTKKAATGNGIRIAYAQGPIYVGFARESLKNSKFDVNTLYGAGSVSYPTLVYTERKSNNLSATYDMGVAKLGFVHNSTKVTGDATYSSVKWTANTVSAAMPMGTITLLGSIGNGEASYDSTVTDKGTDKFTAYQLGVKYDLSKRTNLYLCTGQTKAKEDNVKSTQTSIGVKHSF